MPKKVSKHKTAKRKVTKRKVARRDGVQRDSVVLNDVVNYSAVFKSIDDALRRDAGCSSELDYIEQTSWVLFLKYLEDYENEREELAEVNGETYERIIVGKYRWSEWAAPKDDDGQLDYENALAGAPLMMFVNDELFGYLSNMKINAAGENQPILKVQVGIVFEKLRNKLQNPIVLREVINKVDKLEFLSDKGKHELSGLYEDRIKRMGNAGRNGGEYYTPRPLIQSIVKIINPKIGETVYDGAVGSAGFLCEAYAWMSRNEPSGTAYETLQSKTFYGKENKELAYIIGLMNMLLHGIESPNLVRGDTLKESTFTIQPQNQVDVVLANPPFGAANMPEVQHNFAIQSSEMAYLFLQHFIKKLKAGGRCGVVIKNTFLSNAGNADIALRKQLLEDCDLFAVLDLPSGAFLGTGVKTVVLFFTKGKPTKKIWYYQLNPGRKLGKTNPLVESDLAEFVKLAATRKKGENSWLVNVGELDGKTFDLTVDNPNRVEDVDTRTPTEIVAEINELDSQSGIALQEIKGVL